MGRAGLEPATYGLWSWCTGNSRRQPATATHYGPPPADRLPEAFGAKFGAKFWPSCRRTAEDGSWERGTLGPVGIMIARGAADVDSGRGGLRREARTRRGVFEPRPGDDTSPAGPLSTFCTASSRSSFPPGDASSCTSSACRSRPIPVERPRIRIRIDADQMPVSGPGEAGLKTASNWAELPPGGRGWPQSVERTSQSFAELTIAGSWWWPRARRKREDVRRALRSRRAACRSRSSPASTYSRLRPPSQSLPPGDPRATTAVEHFGIPLHPSPCFSPPVATLPPFHRCCAECNTRLSKARMMGRGGLEPPTYGL